MDVDEGMSWPRLGICAGAGALTMSAIFHQFEAFTGFSIFTAIFIAICVSSVLYFVLNPNKRRSDWLEFFSDLVWMIMVYCCIWDER